MKRDMKRSTIILIAVACLLALVAATTGSASAQVAATSTTVAPPADTTGPLYGKAALFCGDSICQGVMDTAYAPAKGWAGRIAAHYGMTVTNKGMPGASLSTSRMSRILTQIEEVKDNQYDYVVLQGLAGDALESAPVGAMSDSFDVADFDVTTYAGGLEELFYYAKQYFGEETYVGYIIGYQTPKTEMGGRMTDMSEYVDVAIPICDKWGIPYLDLYDDAHFNNDLLKVTTAEYLPDYLHPNEAGYDVLYKPIAAWMETMGARSYTPYWIIGGVVVGVIVVAGGTTLVLVRKRRAQV